MPIDESPRDRLLTAAIEHLAQDGSADVGGTTSAFDKARQLMQFETTVQVDAPAEAVWEALIDVERWPEWTESMRDVRWRDDGGMRIGARARIKQPSTPPLTWTVTDLDPGRAFAWETSSPGAKTIGTHAVSATGERTSSLTLGLKQTGVLAKLVGALTGARTRKFVQMEAKGLKRAAESTSAGRAAGGRQATD